MGGELDGGSGGVRVGRLGTLDIRGGWLANVGSAMKGAMGWMTAAVMATLHGAGTSESQETSEPWIPESHGPRYFAVRVEDVHRSAAWYRRAFGIEDAGGSEAEDGSWRIRDPDGNVIQLFSNLEAGDAGRTP